MPPATLLIELDGEPEAAETAQAAKAAEAPSAGATKVTSAEVAKASAAAAKSSSAPSSQAKREEVEGVQQNDPKRGRAEDRGKAVKGFGQPQVSQSGSCKLAFNYNLDKPIFDDPAAAACLMRQFNYPKYRLPTVSRMHGASYYRSISAAGSRVSFRFPRSLRYT